MKDEDTANRFSFGFMPSIEFMVLLGATCTDRSNRVSNQESMETQGRPRIRHDGVLAFFLNARRAGKLAQLAQFI